MEINFDHPTGYPGRRAAKVSNESELTAEETVYGVFALLVFWFIGAGLCRLCCGCWFPFCCCARCRRAAARQDDDPKPPRDVVRVGDEVHKLEFLTAKKELNTAYMLWMGAGIFGAHHFYLDRLVHGVMTIATLNFFTLGWMLDGILLPIYVRRFNSRTSAAAGSDATCGRICWRLPPMSFLVSCIFIAMLCYLPRTIHDASIIDIDAARCGTKQNPFEIIGLQRDCAVKFGRSDCDKIAVKKALNKALDKLQQECSMGTKNTTACRKQGELIKKATKCVSQKWKKKSKKDQPAEGEKDEWDVWADSLGEDWKTIGQRVGEKWTQIVESFVPPKEPQPGDEL